MPVEATNVFGLSSRPEQFMDREELAAYLNIHVNTLDRWRAEPGFPEERWGPRTIRFERSLVLRWLRDRQRRAAA